MSRGIDARTGRGVWFKDLTGQQFARLRVIRFVGTNRFNKAVWLCRCDCGQQAKVISGSLCSGRTQSCGCLNRESTVRRSTKHGHRRIVATTPEYSSWRSMVTRCTDPNNISYKNYGAKGICVCERWLHSFENFLADMGPRPDGATLGRTLDLGNYEPGNVFWMTLAEQKLAAMNKRHLLQWAEERDAEAATLELKAA